MTEACAIDLFCGAGGLTSGFEREGLRVVAGIDAEPACRFAYEENNNASFIKRDVSALLASDLDDLWGDATVRILIGCAPCQPFSTYTQGRIAGEDDRWRLLDAFGRLIRETRPDIVSMENVASLLKHEVHKSFLSLLGEEGYQIEEHIVRCEDYGIPQRRRRLVLLASCRGPIQLLTPLEFGAEALTVRNSIGSLPPLGASAQDQNDPLHMASGLSPLNLERIRASRPGGSWRQWEPALVASCHRKHEGKGYGSVYGRMEWDKVAPTMTTQAYAFGSGRFGHPSQDRGLSLREMAILQTFPPKYAFTPPGADIHFKTVGRMIGNAVPVQLGRVIARSILKAVDAWKPTPNPGLPLQPMETQE